MKEQAEALTNKLMEDGALAMAGTAGGLQTMGAQAGIEQWIINHGTLLSLALGALILLSNWIFFLRNDHMRSQELKARQNGQVMHIADDEAA